MPKISKILDSFDFDNIGIEIDTVEYPKSKKLDFTIYFILLILSHPNNNLDSISNFLL